MHPEEERPRLARELVQVIERAARGGLRGASPVLGVLRRAPEKGLALQKIAVNGEAGLAIRVAGRLIAVMSFATDGHKILGVYNVLNPDKLRGVPPVRQH